MAAARKSNKSIFIKACADMIKTIVTDALNQGIFKTVNGTLEEIAVIRITIITVTKLFKGKFHKY